MNLPNRRSVYICVFGVTSFEVFKTLSLKFLKLFSKNKTLNLISKSIVFYTIVFIFFLINVNS